MNADFATDRIALRRQGRPNPQAGKNRQSTECDGGRLPFACSQQTALEDAIKERRKFSRQTAKLDMLAE